jgi:hypothetical protein
VLDFGEDALAAAHEGKSASKAWKGASTLNLAGLHLGEDADAKLAAAIEMFGFAAAAFAAAGGAGGSGGSSSAANPTKPAAEAEEEALVIPEVCGGVMYGATLPSRRGRGGAATLTPMPPLPCAKSCRGGGLHKLNAVYP